MTKRGAEKSDAKEGFFRTSITLPEVMSKALVQRYEFEEPRETLHK